MVIKDDPAVAADRNVDAGLFEIFIPSLGDFDQRGGLTAADAFRFPGDSDRSAADAYLYEVRAALRQEAESIAVDDVSRSDFHGITVC